MVEVGPLKIILTGKDGQIGWELQRTLACIGEVIALGRQRFDLTKPDAIRSTIRETKPDLIVNAAAYTAVDKAESEPELAMAVNGVAPGIIAEEAERVGALLVHYSTDYVFDGTKGSPYTEEDTPNPLNVYGKTKFAGEQAIKAVGAQHLILRTSWVYGNRGRNFLLTILRLGKERDELRIVNDQIGAPTWSRMVAEATAQIALLVLRRQGRSTPDSGVYHLCCDGAASWFDFARAITEYTARFPPSDSRWPRSQSPRIVPISTSDYPVPARRPASSRLSGARVYQDFGIALPDWSAALGLCLESAVSES